MQAHGGESILFYLLSVPALEKTKPPSGGSQAVFSTLVTNKQKRVGGIFFQQTSKRAA